MLDTDGQTDKWTERQMDTEGDDQVNKQTDGQDTQTDG
jgi:hypothetical protein